METEGAVIIPCKKVWKPRRAVTKSCEFWYTFENRIQENSRSEIKLNSELLFELATFEINEI